MSKLNILRRLMFALPFTEANFKTRGFQEGEPAQLRLEQVAKVVVGGYNTALETGLSNDLFSNSGMVKKELVGFFNEGVGMGLYTLDLFSIGNRNRFWRFIKGQGSHHEYMSYIGAGIACGVFKNRPIKKFTEKASPTSGLLLLNGIGFYYAYFKPKKALNKHFVPSDVQKDSFYVDCYDNGVGRALWFYHGANPNSIANTIEKFPTERRAAIWSGVGLAATYAGGVSEMDINLLKKLSGQYAPYVGEGSMLASHTRDLAGNKHTDDSTVRILTGRSADDCNAYAIIANEKLENRRMIDGKHSLQVFLEDLRGWLENPELHSQNKAIASVDQTLS